MNLKSSKSGIITILAHVLVWVVFAIGMFFYHPLFSGIDIGYEAWISQTFTLMLLIIAFYINVFLLVPRLLLNNRVAYYLAAIIALVIMILIVNRAVEAAIQPGRFLAIYRKPSILVKIVPAMKLNFRRPIDRPTILVTALVLGIGTSLTAIQKWQKDKQRREELEREKVSSELSFLKAQINPHFFFNTLNNIYALTQVNPDEAGKAIHQLSRMMRYLLYETQQGQTMLSKEIAFVKDYISLMELRLTNTIRVSINTPSVVADMPMSPMMLLPFVENAFKHGVSPTEQSHVDIDIAQHGTVVDISVKNSILKDKSMSLDTNSGIGLANTRRRLDLLYPEKHSIDICERNASNEYSVHLTIDLK